MVTSTQWVSYEKYLYEHSISYRYASNNINKISSRYLKYRKKNIVKWLWYYLNYKIVYYFYHKEYKRHNLNYIKQFWGHIHTNL